MKRGSSAIEPDAGSRGLASPAAEHDVGERKSSIFGASHVRTVPQGGSLTPVACIAAGSRTFCFRPAGWLDRGDIDIVLTSIERVGRLARAFESCTIAIALWMRWYRVENVSSAADGTLEVRHRFPPTMDADHLSQPHPRVARISRWGRVPRARSSSAREVHEATEKAVPGVSHINVVPRVPLEPI